MIKSSTSVLIIFFLLIINKTLYADEKQKIINNINDIETLEFDFNQTSLDKKEIGKCFLKRPHFLKCFYNDENQKQLIVNRNNLIIYHERYDKSYFYPTKKSYFLDILDKKKFESLILLGSIEQKNSKFEIKYLDQNKGEITFYFNLNSFDLEGWKITNLIGGQTSFELNNILKNQEIDKELFRVPNTN